MNFDIIADALNFAIENGSGQNQENRRPEKSGLTPPPPPAIMLATMGEKPTP